MNTTNIAIAVKKELEKRHMTYRELSSISGVPLDTLNNFFRGKTKNPRIDTLQAIQEALELSKPLEWTEEDYANGVTDKIRIEVNTRQYDWIELGNEVYNIKGEEYYNTLVQMIQGIIKQK